MIRMLDVYDMYACFTVYISLYITKYMFVYIIHTYSEIDIYIQNKVFLFKHTMLVFL